MTAPPTRHNRCVLIAFVLGLAGAAGLRLAGAFVPMFGDESCTTLANITRFFRDRTLLPEDTIYPTFYSYVEAVALGVWSLAQVAAGRAASLAGAGMLFITDQAPLVEPLRVVTVLFDTATVFLSFQLGRRLRGPATGVAAALFVALSLNHLSYARWALPDAPMAFFSTASLLLALRHLDTPRWRWMLGSAVMAGLAASCKYNAAMIVSAVAAAHLLARPPRGRAFSPAWLARLPVAACVCVAAFAAGSPAWLVQPGLMMATFRDTAAHMAAGHYFVPGGPPYVWILDFLLTTESAIGAATLLGLLWAFLAGERRLWVVLCPAVATVAVVGLWNKQSPYYLLGVWPALLALGAVAIHDIVSWLSPRPLVFAAVVAAVAALPAANAAQFAMDQLREDNRVAAEKWIQARLPANAKVGADVMSMPTLYDAKWIQEAGARRAAQLTREADMAIWRRFVSRVRAFDLVPMPVDDPAWLEAAKVEYAVTSSWCSDRFVNGQPPAADHPFHAGFMARRRFYTSLLDRSPASPFRRIAEFWAGSGPRIVILRSRSAWPAGPAGTKSGDAPGPGSAPPP